MDKEKGAKMKMKLFYEVKFKRVSYCYWTIEADSQEEAERIAKEGNINKEGVFTEEDLKSYTFVDCVLEE